MASRRTRGRVMTEAEKRAIVEEATAAYFRYEEDPQRRWCWQYLCEHSLAAGEIPFINPGDGELCWVDPWWMPD